MSDTYEAFYNGKPLNPNRGLPTMSYAQAEDCGLTDSERLWCRTDGDGTVITADEVPYDSNNSVKDKIDSMMDWNLVGLITNTTPQTLPSGTKEILLMVMNTSLGTCFGAIHLSSIALPSVILIPYGANSALQINRSQLTLSFSDTSITNYVCRVFYR